MAGPDLLLIHPPAARPAEPPLGTAVLLSHLRRKGATAEAIDANLEAHLYLLDGDRLAAAAGPAPATALHRAVKNVPRALSFLRSPAAAASFPRYTSAARHLNTALSAYRGAGGSERWTLGDYVHGALSEFSVRDLSRAASGEEGTVFSGYFRDALLPRVVRMRPRGVAVSVNYRHQVLPAFELAGLLRRRLPGVPVYGGGGMFTSWRRSLRGMKLAFLPFDRVGFGPGEGPLAAASGGASPGGGVFFEEGEAVEFLPDFGFAPLREYLSPEPVLPVAATRGCYWRRCRFCPEAVAPIHPYREAGAETFPALLRELSDRYGVRRFHLTDNAIPVAILRSLAVAGSLPRGVSWHGFARFERELLDPEFASSLAAAGCSMLQLGLESGSQPLLDRMGKGTRVADASAILSNLARAGIAAYVYVMLGAPGETETDAERTRFFLAEHAGKIGFLNLSILNLPREASWPGIPEGCEASESGFPGQDEPLGLYRQVPGGGGWGRAHARRFLRQRILGDPEIRAIAARTPPWFGDSHAFFFGGAA
ncbi:MAG: radical protein [Deltaproteobacteria bacterium]|nr:radical protein [Deltaproteobacteria bacterium]